MESIQSAPVPTLCILPFLGGRYWGLKCYSKSIHKLTLVYTPMIYFIHREYTTIHIGVYMNKYSKELKEQALYEYANLNKSRKYIADKYKIPIETFKGWLRKEHINHKCDNLKLDNNSFPSDLIEKSDYRKMTKEELQIELIKKDFEIIKLKKKYPWLNDTDAMESDGHCK